MTFHFTRSKQNKFEINAQRNCYLSLNSTKIRYIFGTLMHKTLNSHKYHLWVQFSNWVSLIRCKYSQLWWRKNARHCMTMPCMKVTYNHSLLLYSLNFVWNYIGQPCYTIPLLSFSYLKGTRFGYFVSCPSTLACVAHSLKGIYSKSSLSIFPCSILELSWKSFFPSFLLKISRIICSRYVGFQTSFTENIFLNVFLVRISICLICT